MHSLNEIYELSEDLKVLYVEDHEETREELSELFETIFPTVIVAKDGKEGLTYFNDNSIDLVITDINMPNMDGITMIDEIRKKDEEIKIIVFSAHEKIEYLSRCIELGVDGFLVKPLNLAKYSQTFYKAVEQIQIKKELNEHKKNLELKVQEQLEELILKNKLIEKNSRLATMGEMIDAIAHQWKTPLSVVTMYIQYLQMNFESDKIDKDETLEYLEKMTFQILHAFETIEEFRTFFRPNTNLEIVTVSSVVESVLLLLKDELIRCLIETEVILECDCKIEINKNEFKHVLINLIQNARDAFIQNEIKKRLITFRIFKKDDKSVIQISDNAGGIPEDIIGDIFSPNFTTKEDIDGTGVGLYLSRQILDKVDASIAVTNIELGACFEIEI